MKQRRILFVSVATVMGGAEVYLARLSDLLAGRAYLFAVCVHPGLADQLRGHGVTVFQVSASFGARLQRLTKYPLLLCVTLWALVSQRIETVHINGYQSAFMIPLARLFGCDTLVTPHHLPEKRMALRWYAVNARWAHCAINVSGVLDRQHHSLLPSVRSVVILNWIPNISDQLRPRPVLPSLRALFVGRLVGDKGVPDLLEAIRMLNGEVALIVAGEGPLRADFEALAAGLPVQFLGYQADPSQLYQQVDVLVVPSHGPEGSCLVALEAMAHGLPCIMSDLPVYREIADNGQSALLCPVGDVVALATAIRTLVNDRDIGAQFARSAFAMIQRKYSAQAATLTYMKLFGIGAAPVAEKGE